MSPLSHYHLPINPITNHHNKAEPQSLLCCSSHPLNILMSHLSHNQLPINSITNDLTLSSVLWPVFIPNECPLFCYVYVWQPSILPLSILLCTSDNHPSSLARFKRSKSVNVKKFPLFKKLNITPLFGHGRIVTTVRPFWPLAMPNIAHSKYLFAFLFQLRFTTVP